MLRFGITIPALLATSVALADLKPDALDCTPKKAARNAAMDATVGMSGRCDAKKASENSVDNAKDKAGDALDIDDRKHRDKKDSDKALGKLKD